MKKFECGKWYIVREPADKKAVGPSGIFWSEELDEFDGLIMQCTYAFFSGIHAFLGNNRSAGFHINWVQGPYESRKEAQDSLLNWGKVNGHVFGATAPAIEYGKLNPQGVTKTLADKQEVMFKNYVRETVATVSKLANKENKKLTDQLKACKVELENAKTERQILHTRDDIEAERATDARNALGDFYAKEISGLTGRVAADFVSVRKVVNHNALASDKDFESLQKMNAEITKATIDSLQEVDKMLWSLEDRIAINANLAKLRTEQTRTDLEWSTVAFKQELVSFLKERHARNKTFRVGDAVYQIDNDQLWTFDPKKKLWTTVKPSSQLVGDAKMKAELAGIDKKAEEDINKIYASFHERQKKREKIESRIKKEFDPGYVAPVLPPSTALSAWSSRVLKASFLKKVAKYTAYAVCAASSAAAGVASTVYLYPIVF